MEEWNKTSLEYDVDRDGALFRWKKEKGVEEKWRIFIREDQSFVQVGQMSTRPSQEELETAIYNATVAESPVTKGIQFFRSFGKKEN